MKKRVEITVVIEIECEDEKLADVQRDFRKLQEKIVEEEHDTIGGQNLTPDCRITVVSKASEIIRQLGLI